MYRIVCESYKNYKKDFTLEGINDYRYIITKPFELILDLDIYEIERKNNSIVYQKLEDFIYLLKKDIEIYPNAKSFLWSLESREVYGKSYEVLSNEEFNELTKILNMFLKLSYWHN